MFDDTCHVHTSRLVSRHVCYALINYAWNQWTYFSAASQTQTFRCLGLLTHDRRRTNFGLHSKSQTHTSTNSSNTRSSAVAKKPRDASCLSGVSFNSIHYVKRNLLLLSASLYFGKGGAYWHRLCRDVVGRWLVVTRVHCGQTVHPRPIVTMEH